MKAILIDMLGFEKRIDIDEDTIAVDIPVAVPPDLSAFIHHRSKSSFPTLVFRKTSEMQGERIVFRIAKK